MCQPRSVGVFKSWPSGVCLRLSAACRCECKEPCCRGFLFGDANTEADTAAPTIPATPMQLDETQQAPPEHAAAAQRKKTKTTKKTAGRKTGGSDSD